MNKPGALSGIKRQEPPLNKISVDLALKLKDTLE
jgi:hypothetical protein